MRRLKNIEGKSEQQLQAIKNQQKKQVETIKDEDEDEDEDEETFHSRLRDESPREKKSTFKNIINDNKIKDAKEEAERLEKLNNTINYDKFFISDNKGKKIIDFSNYMDLDMFANKIFYKSISLRRQKKTTKKHKLHENRY